MIDGFSSVWAWALGFRRLKMLVVMSERTWVWLLKGMPINIRDTGDRPRIGIGC